MGQSDLHHVVVGWYRADRGRSAYTLHWILTAREAVRAES